MDTLSLPIAQQPRLVLVLPALIVVGAVMLGSICAYAVRAAGGPQSVVGLVGVGFLLLGITLAIVSSAGTQGVIRIVPGQTLEVHARWHRARSFDLQELQVRPFLWRTGQHPGVTGVYLELSDRHERVTVGTNDRALMEEFEAGGVKRSIRSPSLSLAAADFRRLLQELPRETTTGREP